MDLHDSSVPQKKNRVSRNKLILSVMRETLVLAGQDNARIPMTILAAMDSAGASLSPWELSKSLGVSINCIAQQLNRLSFNELIEREGVKYQNGNFRPFYKPTEKGRNYLKDKVLELLERIEK